MKILNKVILITVLSSVFVLLLFDYGDIQTELDLSSKINCIDINSEHKNFICNTCFRVATKNKPKEQIKMKSNQPFMIISLRQDVVDIMSCQEWLQTIDYESSISHQSIQKTVVKIQPQVMQKIRNIQNKHSQIVSIKNSKQLKEHGNSVVSDLQNTYFIAFYYSSAQNIRPIRLFYSNLANKQLGLHIIKLLALASTLAVLYIFHCGQKTRPISKYRQNILAVIGILGTLTWTIFGNLQEQQFLFMVFLKVMFFSLTLGIVFGSGRYLFFGIISLLNLAIVFTQPKNNYLHLILQTAIVLVVSWKMSPVTSNQSSSNKKLYLTAAAFLVVLSSFAQCLLRDRLAGQLAAFWLCYLIMLSFLMSIKNMDGLGQFKKQNKEEEKARVQSFEGLPTTQMCEQSENA